MGAARARTARTTGRVEALAIAATPKRRWRASRRPSRRAGPRPEGDRYFDGHGTFSNRYARGHDLTLIEAEAVEGLTTPSPPAATSITRGIDLNALVGRRFPVGEVECLGQRLCEPCAHLERLTEPGTLRALVHIGGLRADVLTDGTIRAGDPVRPAGICVAAIGRRPSRAPPLRSRAAARLARSAAGVEQRDQSSRAIRTIETMPASALAASAVSKCSAATSHRSRAAASRPR